MQVFPDFFVAMEIFCWMNMWKINLQLFLFLRVVIHQFRGKDSQEVLPSKQNTLNKCKGVMTLFLMRCCHAMMQLIFAYLKLSPNKILEISEVKLSFSPNILHFKKVLFQ